MDIEAYLHKDYILSLIRQKRRVDDRDFEEFRPLAITKGYVSTKADGSAHVALGNTKVVVGISIELGEPYPDKPEEGVLSTSAELRPMASPYFEPGPPREDAIELARVVDRGIRESGMLPLDKLFIEDGKVWVVYVDIHVLDHDGNLIDASGIAAAAALSETKLPRYEDGELIKGEYQGNLPLNGIAIPVTTIRIEDELLVDPCLKEEYAQECRLTVTTMDKNIHSMQKGGGHGSLKPQQVEMAIDYAFMHAPQIRKEIEKA